MLLVAQFAKENMDFMNCFQLAHIGFSCTCFGLGLRLTSLRSSYCRIYTESYDLSKMGGSSKHLAQSD